MKRNELLEKVLREVRNESLRDELLRTLFGISAKREQGIPQLKEPRRTLNNKEIYRRMTTVAGGTGVSVARVLDVSPQAYSNQKQRGAISAKSILAMHLKTGVSVDWLIGSWQGCDSEYQTMPPTPEIAIDFPVLTYLSLAEIHDQHTGRTELKWCLTKRQVCLDHDGALIPEDYGALLSLITRYKNETGTPERVKNGGKRLYQVRRVLAYALGDPKLMRHLDHQVKKLTSAYQVDEIECIGKTEFRLFSSKDECLRALESLATINKLTVVKPKFNTIAWDYLIGRGSVPPRKWVIEKLKERQRE